MLSLCQFTGLQGVGIPCPGPGQGYGVGGHCLGPGWRRGGTLSCSWLRDGVGAGGYPELVLFRGMAGGGGQGRGICPGYPLPQPPAPPPPPGKTCHGQVRLLRFHAGGLSCILHTIISFFRLIYSS